MKDETRLRIYTAFGFALLAILALPFALPGMLLAAREREKLRRQRRAEQATRASRSPPGPPT